MAILACIIYKVKKIIKTAFGVASLAAFCAGLFTYFQLSPDLADPDGFYHMRMAHLIAERGVIRDFIWLPFTTLGEYYVDQHYVFHVLMIPFVKFSSPLLGIKVFIILLATTMITSWGLLMRAIPSRWWWLISVVLVLTVPFSFRLNLVKATPLALILVAATIYCLLKEKNWWLLPLAVLFVWSYGGFVMMLVVVVIWGMAHMLQGVHKNWRSWKWWKSFLWPIIITTIGLLVGLLVNPHFPNNIYFYWDQFVQIGIINYQEEIGVGGEWYPYRPGRLLFGSTLLVIATISGLVSRFVQRQWKQIDWFVLGLALFGLLLTLKSKRYVEYFGPYWALAAATWLRDVTWSWSSVVQGFTHRLGRSISYTLIAAVLLMLLVPVVLSDVRRNRNDLKDGISLTRYQAGSEWLRDNAEPNTVVLHSDWDDFPMLFYHNPQNYYINGLDPTFMYKYDSELYSMWVDITLGKYSGSVEAALQTFKARYVIIEEDHVLMYNLINKSSITELVYSDEEVDIFAVSDF